MVEAKNACKQMLSVVFNDGSFSEMPLGSVLEVLHTPESSFSSSCSEPVLLSTTCKLEGIVKVKVEQKAEEDEAMLEKKSKCRRKANVVEG